MEILHWCASLCGNTALVCQPLWKCCTGVPAFVEMLHWCASLCGNTALVCQPLWKCCTGVPAFVEILHWCASLCGNTALVCQPLWMFVCVSIYTLQIQFVYNVSHMKGKASTAKQTCLGSRLGPEWNSYCVWGFWCLPCQLDLLCYHDGLHCKLSLHIYFCGEVLYM